MSRKARLTSLESGKHFFKEGNVRGDQLTTVSFEEHGL